MNGVSNVSKRQSRGGIHAPVYGLNEAGAYCSFTGNFCHKAEDGQRNVLLP